MAQVLPRLGLRRTPRSDTSGPRRLLKTSSWIPPEPPCVALEPTPGHAPSADSCARLGPDTGSAENSKMSEPSPDSPAVNGGVQGGPEGTESHMEGPPSMQAGPSDPYESSGRCSGRHMSMAGEDCDTSEVASLIPLPGPGERTGKDSAPPQEVCPDVVRPPCCHQNGPLPYSNSRERGGGGPPVCQPPRPAGGRLLPQKVRIGSTSSVCTKSSKKSQSSYKSAASQIQEVAGDDCCVHCILAFLFCEFLSLCSVMVGCLTCGGCGGRDGGSGCCCGPDGGCGDEDSCPCSTDCGILGDCCESSDCLEICFECCSICFPG